MRTTPLLDPRDYSTAQVTDAVLTALAAAAADEGSRKENGGWMREDSVTSDVAEIVAGPQREWPGDAFHEKVKRIVKTLVDDGRVVRIGRTRGRAVRYPLANGQMRSSYGSAPVVILATQHAKVLAAHEAAREAQRQASVDADERLTKLNFWLVDKGFADDAVIDFGNSYERVTLPIDVLERLLIEVGERP